MLGTGVFDQLPQQQSATTRYLPSLLSSRRLRHPTGL